MTQSQIAYPHLHSTTHHHHFLLSLTSLSPTPTHEPRGGRRNREEKEEKKKREGEKRGRRSREGGKPLLFVVVWCVGHGGREGVRPRRPNRAKVEMAGVFPPAIESTGVGVESNPNPNHERKKKHNETRVSRDVKGTQLSVYADPSAKILKLGSKLIQNSAGIKKEKIDFLIPLASKAMTLLCPVLDRDSHLTVFDSKEVQGNCGETKWTLHQDFEDRWWRDVKFDEKSVWIWDIKGKSIAQPSTIRCMGVDGEETSGVRNGTKADQRIVGFDEEEKRLQQRTLRGSQRTIQLQRGAYIFCEFQTLRIPGIELNPPASEALRRMHILASDPGIVAIMNKYRWRVGIMTEMAPVGYVGISPKCILGFNKNHGEEISLRLRTDDLKGFRKYESIKKTLLHELAHMVHSEHDANFYALDKKLNEEATALDWTKSKSHTLSGYSHSDHYEEEYYVGTSSNSQRLGGNTPHQLATARESSVAAAYRRMANFSTNISERLEAHGEPDPDDSEFQVHVEHGLDDSRFRVTAEPDPDDSGFQVHEEADRDDSEFNVRVEPDPDDLEFQANVEPDLDDSVMKENVNVGDFMDRDLEDGDNLSPDHHSDSQSGKSMIHAEPDPSNALTHEIMQVELDPDDNELRRIKDPVLALVTRLQKSIEMLKSEVNPDETNSVVQTLFKIIRNVIEHPEDKKFRRLRKANPQFQRNVANYKAAMDVLFLVGFIEDIVSDEIGRLETYLVLKRDDPGLLWLAKSSLETSIVHK
ncbi:hypothetical protein Scep_012684 [Stephania cephalantha]|uniref:WLM domain-containing protein n=1 Tax=Stephania cephalantha TaxID=152367 RepID=A0AAP0JGW0_9MAGN